MSKTAQWSMVYARVLKIWATTCSFLPRLSKCTAQIRYGLGAFHYNSAILKQNLYSKEHDQASNLNQQNIASEKLYLTSDTTAGLRNNTEQVLQDPKVGKDHMPSHLLLWLH